MNIQRVYRGHKGREVSEINHEVAKLEEKARPLFDLVLRKEADVTKLAKVVRRMESRDKMLQDDIFEIERELENCLVTHQKYTDSARINGTPQRFLTKYLRVRLKDHFEHEKELYLVKLADLTKKRSELRKLQLEVEVARRELVPLTAGVVIDVKRARVARLRKMVRAKRLQPSKCSHYGDVHWLKLHTKIHHVIIGLSVLMKRKVINLTTLILGPMKRYGRNPLHISILKCQKVS